MYNGYRIVGTVSYRYCPSKESFYLTLERNQLLSTAGGWGSNEGQLLIPHELSVDWNGDVFVADSCNHRVSVFSKAPFNTNTLSDKDRCLTPRRELTTDKVVMLRRQESQLHPLLLQRRRPPYLLPVSGRDQNARCVFLGSSVWTVNRNPP